MSKKIAEGIGALVLDVKCGRGAFMKNREDARGLAESLVSIGNANGVRTEALLTAMDVPLGRAVGNSLEVIECLETLKGRGPADLEELSLLLAARMLLLAGAAGGAGVADLEEARTRIRAALDSGQGLEKFHEIIAQQGGDPGVVDDYSRLPAAPHRVLVRAHRHGHIASLDAELVGRATMVLGAGRQRVEDRIDPGVGILVLARPGAAVRAGDPVLELHYRDAASLQAALALAEQACRIEDSPPAAQALVLDAVG
jgi:thymidine phosphorylase